MGEAVLNTSGLLEMVEALWASNPGLVDVPVVESPFAVAEKEVRRTWWERLFSWPWRPWVATKKVEQPIVFLGSTGYFNEWRAIVVHPSLAAEVRAFLEKGGHGMSQSKEQTVNHNNEVVVEKVRGAIKDRALYLALLYRSFSKALPPDQVEKLAREAIYEYGRIKGQKDGGKIAPEEWVDHHISKGSGAVFQSRIVKAEDYCEQQMTYCPLLEAWKELGCSQEEIDLLCDMAMEVDRGRADYHGIPLDIPERMGRGDPSCRLILRKKGSGASRERPVCGGVSCGRVNH